MSAELDGPEVAAPGLARSGNRPAAVAILLAVLVAVAAYVLGPHRAFERAGNPWNAAQTVATAAATGDAHAVEPLLEAPDPWRGDFLDWVARTPRPSAVVSSIERVGDGDRQRVTVTAPGSRETRTFTLDRRDHWWGPTYAVVGD